MSEAHSTITNVDEDIPVTSPPPAFSWRLISIVSCGTRGLKSGITRSIKGSCDTNRNLRDPTKALVGSQNFKLHDRLQNKNSEPKARLWLQKKITRAKKLGSGSKKNIRAKKLGSGSKKIIRAKKFGSGSKKNKQSQKVRLWLQKKIIRAKKLGSGSKKIKQSQKARLWLQKKFKA